MNRKYWTLVALSEAGPEGLTPVKLQKALFLVGKELAPRNFYQFKAYHYGPFDSRVYSDLELLTDDGLVTKVPSASGNWNVYQATVAGLARAEDVKRKLPRREVDFFARLVKWIKPLSFQALVRYIYDKYPDMRANSVFCE